jgi:hypothetical protein
MPNNKRKDKGSSKGKGKSGAGNAQDTDGKPCSRLRV